MDAVTVVKKGWAGILKGFYEWLRTEKGFELPDSTDSLVNEWIEIQLARLGSTLNVVADVVGRKTDPPIDQEEPD